MTKPKPEPKSARKGPNDSLTVVRSDGLTDAQAVARTIMEPDFRHGMLNHQLLKAAMGKGNDSPGVGDFADALKAQGNHAAKGELEFASRTLAAQAATLDTIFAEMARRMAVNMGEYLSATDTYARIALKAQAQSRATLETLAKLHQPREQTVRHVHVNEGGQAVIADQFHHHAPPQPGAEQNGQTDEQPHAPGAITGPTGQGTALPSPDPFGRGVPIASGERCAAMQDARRQG